MYNCCCTGTEADNLFNNSDTEYVQVLFGVISTSLIVPCLTLRVGRTGAVMYRVVLLIKWVILPSVFSSVSGVKQGTVFKTSGGLHLI